MRTSQKTPEAIFTIGLDLGTNTFQLVGMVHIFVSERSGRGLIRGGDAFEERRLSAVSVSGGPVLSPNLLGAMLLEYLDRAFLFLEPIHADRQDDVLLGSYSVEAP